MQQVQVIRGQDKLYPFWVRWSHISKFCGGYVRYMCSPAVAPAEPGDIDLYPNSIEARDIIVNDLLKLGYRPQFSSPVATSFHFAVGALEGMPKLQVITPINNGAIVAEGTTRQIIESFDFTCVRIGLVTPWLAIADDDFLKDEMDKKLVIKNIHCPISSIKRISKYLSRGYKIAPFELLKLYKDWDDRPAEYKEELQLGLEQMASAETFWDIDEDTRNRIQTLLYAD